jgi:hypothetical protein
MAASLGVKSVVRDSVKRRYRRTMCAAVAVICRVCVTVRLL